MLLNLPEDQCGESLLEPSDLETDVYGRLHTLSCKCEGLHTTVATVARSTRHGRPRLRSTHWREQLSAAHSTFSAPSA